MGSGGEHSLFSMVEAGEWEQLGKCLEEDEGLVKQLSDWSPEGRTPLELAALLGKGEVARVLVNKGAQINATNKSGTSLDLTCS